MNDFAFNIAGYYSFRFLRSKEGNRQGNKYDAINFVTDRLFQLIYLVEGDFKVKYAKGELTVSSGQLLYFPPDWKWEFSFGESEYIRGIVFNFRSWPDVDEVEYPPQVAETTPYLKRLFTEFPVSVTRVDCRYIWQTYRLLSTVLPELKKNDEKNVEIIMDVLEYMKSTNSYTVPELVQRSGMKKSSFYALFTRVTGNTPVHVKTRFQALKAERLLHTTDMSIEEISTTLGFSSVPHFRKVMHKRYGCSPNALRRLTVVGIHPSRVLGSNPNSNKF